MSQPASDVRAVSETLIAICRAARLSANELLDGPVNTTQLVDLVAAADGLVARGWDKNLALRAFLLLSLIHI